ncbi:MAG TPA: FtsX-like permease family protein [Gemmatimonadaceae bacterium]|nr:FtsX-like permease family protein [Gemmatimonadaceae bacterium]
MPSIRSWRTHPNAAIAKVVASDWVDSLELATWNGLRVIVNVLWECKPRPHDDPDLQEAQSERTAVDELTGDLIPDVTTLEESAAIVLLPQRFAVIVTATLGLLGLLLAAIGLYGVVSFTTAQRTREVGVRVALGAVQNDIVKLIVRDGMGVVGIGIAIGLVAALAATRMLRPFLFGVDPLDAVTYVIRATILGGTAFIASLIPARRAALADPVIALRQY